MTLYILIYIGNLIMFGLGYVVARYNKPETLLKDAIDTIHRNGDNIIFREKFIPTGQIKPKTAQDMQYQKRPAKEREGLDAMRDTLSKIPRPTENDKEEFYG